MNDRPHAPHGKITLHGNGLGVPSPEMVEKRAREIAMIDEREADEFTETDWAQAKNEMTGVEAAHAPEAEDEGTDEMSDRDDVLGPSGHQVPNNGFAGDEHVREARVRGGLGERGPGHMVGARRGQPVSVRPGTGRKARAAGAEGRGRDADRTPAAAASSGWRALDGAASVTVAWRAYRGGVQRPARVASRVSRE